MIEEPCKHYAPYWELDGREKGVSVHLPSYHAWKSWTTLKEEACHSKDGFQTLLQERECTTCGLLQQRRIRL